MADETFSAKQVARRIGTDAKTFRKWLRSTASPYTAVGQGQRYDFPQKDLPKIDKAFHAWKDRGAKKITTSVNGKPKAEPALFSTIDLSATPMLERITKRKQYDLERETRQKARDKEYTTIDGEEPTEEELAQLENLELDLED